MRFERLADAQFRFGIDAGSGFVQNQNARIVRQRARKADQLFLSGGEAVAALADRRVESLRQISTKSSRFTCSAASARPRQ